MNESKDTKGDIDIILLINKIKENRKSYYKIIGISLILGFVFAFVSPVKYRSTAVIYPSTNKKIGSFGNLGALAGLVGVNLNDMVSSEDRIPSEIYPQIVKSYTFLNEIMNMKYYFNKEDSFITFYKYMKEYKHNSVEDLILNYTIRLPWTLKKKILGENNDNTDDNKKLKVIKISEEDFKLMESLKEMIQLDVNEKNGLVTVTVEAGEPILSAQLTRKVIELLQKYIIEYKTKKARERFNFLNERFKEKKKEYEDVQLSFFDYKDKHRNIVPDRTDFEYQLLSDKYEITSAVYKGLAQQVEQAKIIIKEDTPVFSIIKPEVVPIKKSKPKRLMIIFSFLFLGFLISLVKMYLKEYK